MKRILFMVVLLIVVFFIGCGWKESVEEPAEEDGGVRNDSSYDAPKVIESNLIIAFQCEFSALALSEDDTYLSGKNYQLEARLKDGAVKGRYHSYGRYDEGEDAIFAADHSFMHKVQEIVAKYDFAQYNGTSITVSGLPEMYGVSLQIVYASGERIDAGNNQECFLPVAAIEELEMLFRQELPAVSVSNNVTEE